MLKQLIEEKLSDYEMMVYFNPYFHNMKMAELFSDKEDLYYQSCGKTQFDIVNGITFSSMGMDKIVDEILAADSHIEQKEKAYMNRVEVLSTLTPHEQDILIEYFYEQYFNHNNIGSPVIDDLKVRLYFLELEFRKDRNAVREAENDRIERIKNYVPEAPEREKMIIF